MTDADRRVIETLDNLRGPTVRLRRSLAQGGTVFPIDGATITDAAVDEIDKFLQRFQQVTDITLRKPFPRIAVVVTGARSPHFFRDMLDTLEKAEVIAAAKWWADLNEQRNRLVHEYAMEPDVRCAELNAAWDSAATLVAELERIESLTKTW